MHNIYIDVRRSMNVLTGDLTYVLYDCIVALHTEYFILKIIIYKLYTINFMYTLHNYVM